MGFLDIFKKKKMKRDSFKKEDSMEIEKEVVEFADDNNESFINLDKEIEDLIISEVLNVIQHHDKFEELKNSAEIAAKNIGEEHINLLPEYLIGKIGKPNELKGKYENLGEWPMVVENSVLMIIFSYKEKGIDILTEIAYGNTSLKLKAINLLIKLAVEGISTEKIIDDIMNNIIEFSDDDKIIIFGFAAQLKGNNKIIALIQHFYKEFLKNQDVERAYEALIYLMNVAQRCTSGHLNFLKFIAMNARQIDLKKVIDVKDGEIDVIDTGHIEEITKIRAAVTFYNINQEDEDINNLLIYWSENYNNEEVKKEIKKIFECKN